MVHVIVDVTCVNTMQYTVMYYILNIKVVHSGTTVAAAAVASPMLVVNMLV